MMMMIRMMREYSIKALTDAYQGTRVMELLTTSGPPRN